MFVIKFILGGGIHEMGDKNAAFSANPSSATL
jgi:hypothetical protein